MGVCYSNVFVVVVTTTQHLCGIYFYKNAAGLHLVQSYTRNLTFIVVVCCTQRTLWWWRTSFFLFECIFGSIPRYFGNTSKARPKSCGMEFLFSRDGRDSVVGELLVVPGLSVIVMLFFWMSKCSVYHRRCWLFFQDILRFSCWAPGL